MTTTHLLSGNRVLNPKLNTAVAESQPDSSRRKRCLRRSSQASWSPWTFQQRTLDNGFRCFSKPLALNLCLSVGVSWGQTCLVAIFLWFRYQLPLPWCSDSADYGRGKEVQVKLSYIYLCGSRLDTAVTFDITL